MYLLFTSPICKIFILILLRNLSYYLALLPDLFFLPVYSDFYETDKYNYVSSISLIINQFIINYLKLIREYHNFTYDVYMKL